MTRKSLLLLTGVLLVLFVVGCGAPAATPTKPPVTLAPVQQVTVIITATPPPVTPTVELPTLAPSPVITATVPVNTPVAVKATTAPAKATAARTPTKAGTVVPSPLPQKYAAPKPLEPIWIADQGAQKDERHFPSDALQFKWTSVGGLAGDECYQLHVAMVPGAADSFLVGCGDGSGTGFPVANATYNGYSFALWQPNRGGPNYSSLLPNPNSDTWVNWTVTVVKDLGKGTGPQDTSGARHNTAPLGPTSAKVQFLLKGQ